MSLDLKRFKKILEEEGIITESARIYAEEKGIEYSESLRKRFSYLINKEKREDKKEGLDSDLEVGTTTETNQYDNEKGKKKVQHFSAIGEDGKMMDIEQYCEHYGLDLDKIKSYKLVSHTGVPYFNIAFFESVVESQVSEEELKTLVEEGLANIKFTPNTTEGSGTGVVKVADFHFGSLVEGLIRTKDFSLDILAKKLDRAVAEINRRNYKTVHVHILGDLIESFTGKSHANTWKGIEKATVGAKAVKIACTVIHEQFLSKINNLGEVKLVAGNHDRITSDNRDDVQGDAANLIGWGLGLMGYKVEFNPLVISHKVDGICHIITHGHHAISKKTTKQICWDYGEQGMYNLICEGHLHSIIEKLTLRQRSNFQTVKDDAVDHRRFNCPSFFTGNFFSEALGYTSQSGFVITEDNGEGVPNVFYYAV